MSDPKMMSVTEARAWLDPSTGPKPEVPSPLLVDRYARTIVHLAEQIERLQAALRKAEVARREVWVQYGVDIDPHGKVHWDAQYPDLLPGDMEARHE